MKSDELIPIATLARYLGLPVAWLKREAITGHIPALRVGRRYYFNLAAVERALTRLAAESSPRFSANEEDQTIK